MTATHVRTRASLEELQAAAAAAQRGEFALRWRADVKNGEPDAWRLAMRAAPARTCRSAWHPGGTVVAVAAAHSGAGSSTVAVLLAEALCETGRATRVVEVADPSRSGLAAATNAELGEHATGWRRGRRGDIHIDRLARPLPSVEQVPAPAAATDADEVVVLDIGCPAREVLAADGWVAAALTSAPLLIVCRTTVPGIRQTEYLLADLADLCSVPVMVAAVGPARWPGAAVSSAGPQLRAARESGRLITVPIDRRIQTDGVSAAALPKSVAVAGRSLAAALASTGRYEHPAGQSPLGSAGGDARKGSA
jgi:hypothetical protein